jgi:outer membrane lipoprotein SlyB
MKMRRILISSLCAVSLVSLSACVTDPNTGQQKVSRTAIGAGGGALAGLLLGGLIGGGTGRIIGAGIGGIAGAAVGYTYDKQIKQLREQTAGTGVDVTPVDGGKAILVISGANVTVRDLALTRARARNILTRAVMVVALRWAILASRRSLRCSFSSTRSTVRQ